MVKETPPKIVKATLKRKAPATTDAGPSAVESEVTGNEVVPVTDVAVSEEIKEEKHFVFKKQSFNYHGTVNNKKRVWKSLKQILTHERSLPWPESYVHYSHISAPPSFKPAKKYSDISGLTAKYTDPQTKLQYAMAEEFSTVRSLPSDIISGYLSLRGVNSVIG
ncbi:unnamed protein product [Bemisia tabaci]|uniref:Vps72/YL1 C-terminal domain-containing protein n=1 Tax=Bemisia tabaci TaxID=7038 RepID=A0A9P0EWN4_BEMTA|nr:PREDICTED: INO80 complex subunit C [Bemisia tabaci]CAH0382261.1 unnamed protein product [Bemisia tabaci]